MRFNHFTKLGLPALLLGAGMMAYAADEVKLNNNAGIVDWDYFVGVLNGTNEVTAPELGEDAPSKVALAAAEEELTAAKAETNDNALYKALADAKSTLTSAENALNGTGGATSLAQLVTEAEGAVTEAQNAYDNYVKVLQDTVVRRQNLLQTYKDKLSELQTKQATYNTDLTSASAAINTASNAYNKAASNLAQLTKVPVETRPEWLETAESGADLLVNSLSTTANDSNGTFYYKTEEGEDWTGATSLNFYMAFSDPGVDSGYTGPITVGGFKKLFAKATESSAAGPLYGKTVNGVFVYLGSEYATSSANSSGLPTINAGTYNGTIGNIPASIKTVVDQVYANKKYITTTYEYSSDDKALASQYQATMAQAQKDEDKAQNNYNKIESELKGGTEYYITGSDGNLTYDADGKITNQKTSFTVAESINGQISTVQSSINDLNLTDTANSKYDASIAAAQAAVTAAQNATASDAANATEAEQLLQTIKVKQGLLEQAKTNLTNGQNAVDEAQEDVDTAQAAFDKAIADAQDKVTKCEADVEAAQAAANTAARANYNRVTLAANVTAKTQIADFPSGCSINGGGYIINVETTDGYLFDSFGGAMSNVAVNGNTFHDNSGGRFTNVARWNGTKGIFYGESNTGTEYTTIGSLGYAVRDRFGISFTNSIGTGNNARKGTIEKLADDTKVFSVAVYDDPNSTPTSRFVVVNANKTSMAYSGGTLTINANRFAKSADADIAQISDFAVPNVYYTDDENNNVCPVAQITDKVTFYSPEEIQVTSLSYNRDFSGVGSDKQNAVVNSICLPFTVAESDIPGCLGLFTYESQTATSFKFRQIGESVAPNTPVLVASSQDFQISDIEATITATNPADIVKYTLNGKNSYGTYKQGTTVAEFIDTFDSYKIFGVTTNSEGGSAFQALGEKAKLPAFRMVVESSLEDEASTVQSAPRKIVFLDERGIEIGDFTTSIDRIDQDVPEFSIKGGVGEIVFTSDVEMGEVPVYSINGSVVAMVNVTEGTTSVNVVKGLYIVKGQKVMVK